MLARKWNTVRDVLLKEPKQLSAFNKAFLEEVAWAFMTSGLRSRLVGRGISLSKVRNNGF